MELRQETQLAHTGQLRYPLCTSTEETLLGVWDWTEWESSSLEMNRGLHTSYQYSIVNMKQGSDNREEKHGPDYMRLPQYLSYMEQSMEEQKNEYCFGRFQHLQGRFGHMMTLIP